MVKFLQTEDKVLCQKPLKNEDKVLLNVQAPTRSLDLKYLNLPRDYMKFASVPNNFVSSLFSNQVKAFLDVLAYTEGTWKSRTEFGGYDIRYPATKFELFTSAGKYATHPHVEVAVRGQKRPSSAAGRYQIVFETWKDIVTKFIDKNATAEDYPFSPENQDKVAVLILGKYLKILDEIEDGNIDEVFEAENLKKRWTSLNIESEKMAQLKILYWYRISFYEQKDTIDFDIDFD